MKKIALLALLIGTMPLSMQAQDDMYLIPSKSKRSLTPLLSPRTAR